jgi:hypothetical protein
MKFDPERPAKLRGLSCSPGLRLMLAIASSRPSQEAQAELNSWRFNYPITVLNS